MPAPTYKMTIGDTVVDTTIGPQAGALVALTVTLALGTSANNFRLVLDQTGAWRPRREDAATIALGHGDKTGAPTPVITGTVDTVESGLTTMRVIGYSGAGALRRAPAEQIYENQSAGAIVRDLATQAGVAMGTVAAGPRFPTYVVDGRRAIYYHMQNLAALAGYDLYFTPAGKLVFAPFTSGRTVHVLEYARHLLALEVWRLPAAAGRGEVCGESAADHRGGDAGAGLRERLARGSARLLERPALRAPALAGIPREAVRGTLCTIGQPQIRLGDAILLRGLPDTSLDGCYQVSAVTHRITLHDGFTTTVAFHTIAA